MHRDETWYVAYIFIISMTITRFHEDRILFEKPQAIFFKTTSSLLKLANCSMHGGETWCACVLYTSFTHADETWYTCVLHHFHDNYMFL